MIRIAFITSTLDVGGAESQLLALAARLDRRRFAPAVYCLSEDGALSQPLRDAGVPVTSLGVRNPALSGRPLEVVNRLGPLFPGVSRQQPHIVHGLLFHGYLAAAAAGKWSRARTVIASRRSLSHFKRDRPLLRAVERVANRWTNLVIANSEAVREDAIRTEGLPPGKVIVIYNGLQAERYDLPPQPALRARLAAVPDGPIAITVANLIEYKGHHVLLDAWRGVQRAFPGATLLLAGDGPLRATLERAAAHLGLGDRVRFLGVRRDIPELLAASDLLVHPSSEEGFSNAILEGMAAGRPVIATAVGGSPEAIVQGETGILVPAGDSGALRDAVVDLLCSPGTRERLGAAARASASTRFTVERMVHEYETVYERALSEPGRRVAGVSEA